MRVESHYVISERETIVIRVGDDRRRRTRKGVCYQAIDIVFTAIVNEGERKRIGILVCSDSRRVRIRKALCCQSIVIFFTTIINERRRI